MYAGDLTKIVVNSTFFKGHVPYYEVGLYDDDDYNAELKIADIVFADENHHNIIGIEIKSSHDNIKRAIKQCRTYARYCNQVYVVGEASHRLRAEKVIPEEYGVLYSEQIKKSGYEITLARESKCRDIDIELFWNHLSCLRLKYLLKKHGQKVSGLKIELQGRVKEHYSDNNGFDFEGDIKKMFLMPYDVAKTEYLELPTLKPFRVRERKIYPDQCLIDDFGRHES